MTAATNSWHDERALGRFDLFLFAAVVSVLVTRTFLAVTGYPQVGSSAGDHAPIAVNESRHDTGSGGGLHVAHVLWGGLLMGVAIALIEILPGNRARIHAALIGGVGFGLFIDEVGKFLTKNVNYFYRPAITIIYATFVVAYLVVREVLMHRNLTDRRRLAIASSALSDLALGELDKPSRDYALQLLDGVDQTSGLAQAASAVRTALHAETPARTGIFVRLRVQRDRIEHRIGDIADRFLTRTVVLVMFLADGFGIVISAHAAMAGHGDRAWLDTGLPSLISGAFLVAGLFQLRENIAGALRMLQRAVLVELLFTEFIVYERDRWLGLLGYVLNILVFWLTRIALRRRPARVFADQGRP